MQELDPFVDELIGAAPEVAAAMRAAGDDPRPDHEVATLWLGSLGAALATTLPSLPEDVAKRCMDIVERHLARGSQVFQDAICTGLLEAISSAVSGGRLDGPFLAGLLGPKSRAYIDAWDQFSLGRSSLGGES